MQATTVSLVVLITTLLVCHIALGQYEGEECAPPTGGLGRCLEIRQCAIAEQLLKQNIRPKTCEFKGSNPIICCPNDSPVRAVASPGTTSRQKCEAYASGSSSRKKRKTPFLEEGEEEDQTSKTLVVGGEDSLAKEFPHMAALAFGEENNKQWQCGGSLISDQFVMTAAHCLASQEFGDIRWVRLGDLNLRLTTDDAQPQDFRIIQAIRHPQYRPPSQYNDIAVVRLDRPVQITEYVRPACLQVETNLANTRPIATGWGKLEFIGDTSDHLQKVDLNYFTNGQCRNSYASTPQRRLPNGIVDHMQLCAGGVNEAKDTCQGDSGGPLQRVEGSKIYILGVTSFGRGCGAANVPGVYTRVSAYVPWLEQVVWPNA